MLSLKLKRLVCSLVFGLFVGSFAVAQSPDGVGHQAPIADISVSGNSLVWLPNSSYEMIQLKITGPNGWSYSETFSSDKVPSLSLQGRDRMSLPKGTYNYELTVVNHLPNSLADQLESARDAGDNYAVNAILADSGMAFDHQVQFGLFNLGENGASIPVPRPFDSDSDERDQVINDDLIVTQSICIGMDCANGENFGFDTLRLRENNLRIKFDDTSNSGSFPNWDWQLTANDSANGGQNKFSIDDITTGRTPFTIEGSAPSNALYVDDGGRIGFGTSTPSVENHIVNGDSPTVRLQQDGSSGFTPQTWDLVGNEASFFLRDVTNGSKLSFRVRPNAPESSIDIEGTTGDVGFGTASPTAPIHVRRTNGTAKFLVEEANGTPGTRTLFALRNNGVVLYELNDTSNNQVWDIGMNALGSHIWSNRTTSGNQMVLDNTGNLTATTVTPSDRNLKKQFEAVDTVQVLEQVSQLPLLSWSYKKDTDDIRHIGPMAQDFYSAFQFGINDTTISPMDLSSVTMAAVQGLYQLQQEKDVEIATLKEQNEALSSEVAGLKDRLSKQDELEKRLAALEALLNK